MTSMLEFPSRYLGIELVQEVYNYFGYSDEEIDEDELEYLQETEPDEFKEQLKELITTVEDTEILDGIVILKDYECFDEETMSDLEDFLVRRQIPYDSRDGGERYIYSYRPEQGNSVIRSYTHMEADGPVFCLGRLERLLDSLDIADPNVLKQTIIKNLTITGWHNEMPVPLSQLAKDNNYNNFSSIGLAEINNL